MLKNIKFLAAREEYIIFIQFEAIGGKSGKDNHRRIRNALKTGLSPAL